ncbi:MAG: hypothetical protein HFI31_07470 [Lachnospiraceae bacterium]|nr:hypothetical protein [Lachnospiraceae bacterium]
MKIRNIVSFVGGALLGGMGICVLKHREEKETRKDAKKYLDLYRTMSQYVVTKQQHKEVSDYFEENGYERIAVYGMSHMGQRLIDDLKDSKVQVVYGVDQRADRLTYSLPIYRPSEELPQVDAIVVTAYDFDEIEEELAEKVDFQILNFSDIIFGI